jgi:hypothetical protein
MTGVDISIEGLDELTSDFERLISRYPDKAGDLLRKNAREFRKEYIKNVKSAVKTSSGKAKSLTKTRNVKVYPIQGMGKKQYVDVGATSPHFHLFERGHNKVIPWMPNVSGRVEGRFVMKKSIDDYEKKLPEIAEKMCDELLKEGNLS